MAREADQLQESQEADLGKAHKDLAHIRDALSGVEATMLAGLVKSMSDTAETLMRVTSDPRRMQGGEWLKDSELAEKAGVSTESIRNSDAPRHYITPKSPRYNRQECEEHWLSK